MATIKFELHLNCFVALDEDAGVFVSHCPRLSLYSQAETEDDAMEAIKSAIKLHVTTAFDFNRLDKVLRKAGFEKFDGNAPEESTAESEFVKVSVLKDAKTVSVTVPLTLSASAHAQYASAC